MQTQMTQAEEIAFQAAYWNTMAKNAAAVEQDQTKNLFNAAFDNRIAKYAAADPEFGAHWQAELEKAAFNESVEATLNRHGYTWQTA